MASSSADSGGEMELTPAQHATANQLTYRSIALIVFTVIMLVSPVIWIVIPIDGIFNLTVASIVIYWTKKENRRLINKIENGCCGFRSVYYLSIAAAVLATFCMVVRLGISYGFLFLDLPPLVPGSLRIISYLASLLCILLLALIASDSAPTRRVTLTDPEGALVSSEQQDTRAFCCPLIVSRSLCCVCCLVPILVFYFFGGDWFGLLNRDRTGVGYTCETAVFATASPDCSCLTQQQSVDLNLNCNGTNYMNCVSSFDLLCPTSFFTDSYVNTTTLQAMFRPDCLVAPNCTSSDSSPAKAGLRSRPCEVRTCSHY